MQSRHHIRFLITTVSILLVATVSPVRAQNIPAGAAFMPGEVIFKLRSGTFESSEYKTDLMARGRSGLAAVDVELVHLDASSIGRVFPSEINAERKRAAGMDRIFLARYAGADTPPDAAARLAALSEIEWAEPNAIGHGSLSPNDPTYGLQWGLRNRGQAIQADGDSVGTWDCDLDANQAWDVQTGSFSVVLAILDTGIDAGHPEFSGRVQSGWNFIHNNSNPADDRGHGTGCAGVAAARGNNGQGIAGVAWGVRILPVKVLDASNMGTIEGIAAGVTYAADFGAQVISMSMDTGASATLLTAINYAYGLDCVIVAASGNFNESSVDFPAAYDHVIAVGALSPCNERKSPTSCDGETDWGSNYGAELDLLAPGVRIHTTDILGGPGEGPGDYVSAFGGTSIATPFVAGIVALMRSQVNLTNDQITSILLKSCDDLGAPSWDQETGWGRVNIYAAMRALTGAVFVGPNPGTETGEYRTPFRTVTAGVNAVQAGNYVVVKPGDYDEATPWTIQKVVHLDAIDGGVTIR